MSRACPPLETLVDYLAGDLGPTDADTVEEHYFGCARCTRRLQGVQAMGHAVSAAVREGSIQVSVTPVELERAVRDGLTIRRYDVAPGGGVQCTAAPDDDFIAVCLSGPFPSHGATLELHRRALATGASETTTYHLAVVDDQVVVLLPGDAVRAFPRAVFTMHVVADGLRVGPFTFDHTPWGEQR